jgi:tetratricopeptide (TPR) repeat protein
MTRLWGVVGLARQGLDDFEGARFAFEEAIALAPQSERETWERHLAGLASIAARRSLDEAAAGPARAERIETIRSAIDWLERALAVAPEDAALRDTLLAARAALWRANEDVVKALIRRKAFDEVRRRLEEVSADPECPPGRQRAFRTLRVRALAGEAVAATTDAMRHLGHGRPEDSMAALARAESVLTEVSGALTAKRRQELTRKLWLGYMKLGIDRLEAGEGEAALGPLCRALRLDASGDARLTETRATLVRTLERVVETRSVEIGALIEAGDAALAAVQGEKLWSLLRGAVDQGLPQDRLTDTFATVEGLFHRIGTRSSS